MANRLTKGKALLGTIAAREVSAGSTGYTMASVSFRIIRIPISAGTTNERDTGVDLPVGAIVQNVYIDTATAEATASNKTIDVGLLSSETGGDTDGFLDGVTTGTVGPVQGSLVAGAVTRGALLSEGTAASGRFGKQHIVITGAATSVVTQVAEAQTEFVGDIVIQYLAVG